MERKIKHIKKAFREYNIRKRGLGQPEVSFEDYISLHKKISTDYNGKLHPKIKHAEQHMIEVFGQHITTERKVCIKCNRTKPLIDFICRYMSMRIENTCKDCERIRKRNLSH